MARPKTEFFNKIGRKPKFKLRHYRRANFLGFLKQDIHRPRATVLRARREERQYLVLLPQPRIHLDLEHRQPAFRAETLAVIFAFAVLVLTGS